MKFSAIKSAVLFLILLFVASIAGAATLTVGPSGQYATPCPAIKAASPGDTITIDYNNGVPYTEPADPTHGNRSDCVWFADNLTIVGVNGRPILDAAGEVIEKGIFNPYGANNVISNLEFRNAATQPGQGSNGAGIRVDSGSNSAPAGGNITVQFCYFHNNEDGILTANVGPGTGGQYEFANPYITFLNDEFAFNGQNGDGHTHNMYIGYDAGNTEVFSLKYSWTHDAFLGHTVKSRAPINNVEYNLITDQWGATSYMLNFPLGGSTYVVGNSIYKSQKTNSSANGGWMLWRDVGDNTPTDPEYGLPLEDLHFVNNTVVLDPTNNTPAYVIASCIASDVSSCSAPSNGPVLSVNAVVENNIFVGPATLVSNQSTAVMNHNLVESNTSANLAALFVDWAHFNFHLVSGAPAINAGIYPPTDNAGNADPNALAVAEYVQPMSYVTRPTPTGSTMDEGAYSYPRVDTPPSPTLSYTTSVTTPGTGTITLSGLPTPPAGKYNNAVFISGNTAVIPAISSASSTTSTVVGQFTACCASGTTSVPIDIYVDGAHLTATVTVVAGPVVLQSVTLDNTYYPETTVHLTNASPSPVVIDLTTTDSSILAVPSSITIPAGQLSAETGSETGSLWGQTPSTKTATISATYAGTTKTLPVVVYAPFANHFYCNVYPCTIVGGQPINNFIVGIAGDFPAGGGPVIFTSDTPSVIPNQTFTAPAGNFYTGFILTTNTVTTNTTVTISVNVNGSTRPSQVVTVTPASGTNIAVSSGSGQAAPVGTNFPNPLVALVQNGSTPVAGATVTFSGSGVAFPNGATAVSNSNGLASVIAQPTAAGSLMVVANTSGAGTPATFAEGGTSSGSGGADVLAIDSSGPTAGTYVADEYFSGGALANTTNTVDTSAVTNPAPEVVYQNWRYGVFSYSIPGLTPNGVYTVRLHFAESVNTGTGQRQFNVAINNTPVLSNFDIFAAAGGANKAVTQSFGVTADGTGHISIQFTKGSAGNPEVSGIEIQSTAAAPTVAVTSGSGQSATVGTNFTSPLVVLVKDGSGNPLPGATVTFAGSGVSFPSGATATTDSNGNAGVTAQPTTTGTLTVTATVSGATGPANFTETGTANTTPASIAVVSGSGQTAAVGASFSNPLVVVVQNSAGVGVSGATVTFAGTGVSFPSGATAVTDTNGNASVTAQPTTAGALTVTASVTGVSPSASFSETGTGGAGGDVIAINSSGAAVGNFAADEDVSGGTGSTFGNTVDTSAVVNPAPQAVYQSQRYGNSTYTIPGLTAGATYSVRLHFAELYWSGTGQRVFNVGINGTQVLTNFDILATAGAANKAVIETFSTTANSSGQIVIQFTTVTDNAAINGIEIQNGTGSVLPSGIILNGSATQPSSTDLRLTDGGGGEASSAYEPTPVNIQGFTNDFTFQLTNPNADGFAFVIQGVGSSAIGATGGGLGYAGIGSSVAVKFDLYDNSGEGTDSTGIYLNGANPFTPSTDLSSTAINLHSGDKFHVHMTYDGTTLTVTTTDLTTNGTATQSYPVNIPSNVGGNTAYVGFTAGTGGLTATQDILAWSFVPSAPPPPPASVAVVSGGGQSANTGTNFANPLVVVVEDASSNPVSGATVTFAGSGVSFPSGATATTNSSGQASVTAQPTSTGSITVTASVAGVGTPASFTETGTSAGVAIASITQDNPYDSFTTVHLVAAAPTGGQVVTLSTSDSSILYTPASVTVPAGATTAETGTLLGSLWGQSPFQKAATLTGVAGGATKTLTMNVYTTSLHSFNVDSNSVKGGQSLGFYMESSYNAAPQGGALYTVSSDQPSIIPTQSFTMPAGQGNDFGRSLTTSTVTTNTTVNLTLNYNGATSGFAVTVTP